MSEFLDVEYEIEKRLIKGLKAIFEKDRRFRYNENQEMSGIKITIDYPDDESAAFKIPHIVVSGIGAQTNLHTSFGYNFYKDVEWKGMKNGAQEYAYVIPYSVTLLCAGQQNESKDLASRVNWYLSFAAAQYMSEQLGLQISEISKGQPSPSKQFPQKIFDTPIQIRGTIYWIGKKGPEDIYSLHDIDKPLKNLNLKFK